MMRRRSTKKKKKKITVSAAEVEHKERRNELKVPMVLANMYNANMRMRKGKSKIHK